MHLGLTEDLEQLIVGQEIEATEPCPLRLKIVAETFLHHVQQLGTLTKFIQKLRIVTELYTPGIDRESVMLQYLTAS